MIEPSSRIKGFLEYAFAKLDEAKKEAEKKFKVIDMGVGDPDLPTDKRIQGKLIYSLGMDEAFNYPSYSGEKYFREAVRTYMINRFKVCLDPQKEILSLIGSKEGIAHLPWAIISPNSNEIGAYTEPGYPVYKSSISFAGGIPFSIPLKKENNFLPELSLIPENTKLLFINYPNNPTSATASLEFFQKVVNLANEKGFIVANDASYVDIYENEPQPSILQAENSKECAIEFHSLSKGFSMTGWRVGFAVGNEKIISYLGAIKKQIDSGIFKPIQAASAEALNNYEFTDYARKIYFDRVKRFKKALISSNLFKHVSETKATFYVWAELKEGKSEDFAAKLLDSTGILCLPGNYMGESGEGFLRFSLTLPDNDLDEAIKRIKAL